MNYTDPTGLFFSANWNSNSQNSVKLGYGVSVGSGKNALYTTSVLTSMVQGSSTGSGDASPLAAGLARSAAPGLEPSGGADTGVVGPFNSAGVGVDVAYGPAVSFASVIDLVTGQAFTMVALGVGTPNVGGGPILSTARPSAGIVWTGTITPAIFGYSPGSWQVSWPGKDGGFDTSWDVSPGVQLNPAVSLMLEVTFGHIWVAPESMRDWYNATVRLGKQDWSAFSRDFSQCAFSC